MATKLQVFSRERNWDLMRTAGAFAQLHNLCEYYQIPDQLRKNLERHERILARAIKDKYEKIKKEVKKEQRLARRKPNQ